MAVLTKCAAIMHLLDLKEEEWGMCDEIERTRLKQRIALIIEQGRLMHGWLKFMIAIDGAIAVATVHLLAKEGEFPLTFSACVLAIIAVLFGHAAIFAQIRENRRFQALYMDDVEKKPDSHIIFGPEVRSMAFLRKASTAKRVKIICSILAVILVLVAASIQLGASFGAKRIQAERVQQSPAGDLPKAAPEE